MPSDNDTVNPPQEQESSFSSIQVVSVPRQSRFSRDEAIRALRFLKFRGIKLSEDAKVVYLALLLTCHHPTGWNSLEEMHSNLEIEEKPFVAALGELESYVLIGALCQGTTRCLFILINPYRGT